ncbi:GSCOCG00012557001-RA-CDS [Cotesia congregata]|nr:GSCOCG00012557001-RA-CDS [Cotesia congregata]
MVDTRVPAIRDFLKKCMSLILLPEQEIDNGFIEAINSVPLYLQPQLQPFLQYMQLKWLNETKIHAMKLFDNTDGIKDISIIFTRELQYRCGGQNMTIWNFLKNYVSFMNIASNDAARIRNHLDARIRFPRSNSFCLERTLLQRQWSLMNDNIITATQFQEALFPRKNIYI